MDYDVRLIRFVKAHTNDDGTDVLPRVNPAEDDVVICLSHFDYLFFKTIIPESSSAMTPLQLISNHRETENQEDNYTYPLYILKEKDATIDSFWGWESDYTSVIRVHHSYDKKDGLQSKNLAEKIQVKLKAWEFKEKEGSFKIPTPIDKGEVKMPAKIQVYDSLELGDSVIVLKCDSLVATLLFSKLLMELRCVLDSYTYLGISPKVFYDKGNRRAQNRDKFKLESASTRFTIHSLSEAKDFFDQIKKQNKGKLDLVTGTTDARIRWNTTTESGFLEQIARFDPADTKLYRAFYDTITRVGTPWVDLGRAEKTIHRSIEYKKLFEDSKYTDKLKQNAWLKNENYLWLSLNKLLASVKTMGQNCVMDDLANLLIPSLHALVERISQLAELKKEEIPHAVDEIHDLIRDYFYLIYDISRLEGQLVQHPELYPAPYYLPAAILQFEMQFTYCCSTLFGETEHETLFYPVLIPHYQSEASTFAPLDPVVYGPRDESNLICPLRIYLPVHLLYDPFTAVHQLCHEVAHYSGSKARARSVRLGLICKCCASMIMTYWENILGYDFSLDWNKKIVQGFLSDLTVTIKEAYSRNGGTEYLSSVRDLIPGVCTEVFLNPSYFDSFHNVLLASHYDNLEDSLHLLQEIVSHSRGFSKLSIAYSAQIRAHILYICTLMKECYADIAMIQLLNSNMDVYLNLLLSALYDSKAVEKKAWQEESTTEAEKEFLLQLADNPALKLQIDRCAFISDCMGWELNGLQSGRIESRIKTQTELLQNRGTEGAATTGNQSELARWNVMSLNESVISPIESACITEYLCGCKQLLDEQLNESSNSDLVGNLRAALKAVSSQDFDWKKVQQFVLKNLFGEDDTQ